VLSAETVAYKLLREIRKDLPRFSGRQIAVSVSPRVGEMLQGPARRALAALSEKLGREIEVRTRPGLHQEQFEVEALDQGPAMAIPVPWLESREERAAAEAARRAAAAEARAAEEKDRRAAAEVVQPEASEIAAASAPTDDALAEPVGASAPAAFEDAFEIADATTPAVEAEPSAPVDGLGEDSILPRLQNRSEDS
jgi:hypothetical protein